MAERDSRRVVGVDRDLDMLFAEVEALRALASDPDASRDSARRYDFSIRWGTLLSGRLERLAFYHSRGELAADEERRYGELRAELSRALPLMRELGMARPAVPLDEDRGG